MNLSEGKIKLVFSDIDGTTIIPGNKLPTEKVIQTIQSLTAKNIKFCFATARPLSMVKDLIELLNLSTPIILAGGSRIYDLKLNKYIWKKNINMKSAKFILKFLEKKKYPYIFTENNTEGNSIKDVEKWEINEIVPLNLTREQIDDTYNGISSIHDIHCTEVGKWNPKSNTDHLQITDIHATKQYAVFETLKYLNINRDDSLGIGDNKNDIPLLSACGIKVAMGNAQPELQHIADFITKPVWEDGFSYAMEKYVL